MSIEFQKCRTWGHAWEDFIPGVGEKRPAAWGRRFSLRCERCTTERHDTFDMRGELSTRHYVYPDDYRLDIDERPELTQLRLSLVSELKERNGHKVSRNGNGHGRRRARPKKTRRLVAV